MINHLTQKDNNQIEVLTMLEIAVLNNTKRESSCAERSML